MHWHLETIFCRIQSVVHHQGLMILAGTGWQGLPAVLLDRCLAICQGNMLMAGRLLGPIRELNQAQPRGLHSGPSWGPRGCWLSWSSSHRLMSPHLTHLPLLISAVLTPRPPQPKAGVHCNSWTECSRPRPRMDCAEHNTSLFFTTAADS